MLRQLGENGGWVILGVRDTKHLAEHQTLLTGTSLDDDDEAAIRQVCV